RDSYSILPILRGQSERPANQDAIVHHSSMGHFAVRKGEWKLIDRPGSGGFSEPATYTPGPGEPEGQLYNLADDPGETKNLYDSLPSKVEELKETLRQLQAL